MPNMSKQYQLILGTFIDNEFVWHDVDSYDTIEEAYREFKKYVNAQLKYTDEELVKVWNTGRLDVELRRGNRLLNWVGIYAREVDKLSEDEEKKADEDKPEKQEKTKAKDSVYPVYKAEITAEIPDIGGETTTAKSTITIVDGGDYDNPEDALFTAAVKKVSVYFKTEPDINIIGYFTCDDEPIDGGYFKAVKKWGKIVWVPTNERITDSDPAKLKFEEPITVGKDEYLGYTPGDYYVAEVLTGDKWSTWGTVLKSNAEDFAEKIKSLYDDVRFREIKRKVNDAGIIWNASEKPEDMPKLMYVTIEERQTGRKLFNSKVYEATQEGSNKAVREATNWLKKNPDVAQRKLKGEVLMRVNRGSEYGMDMRNPSFANYQNQQVKEEPSGLGGYNVKLYNRFGEQIGREINQGDDKTTESGLLRKVLLQTAISPERKDIHYIKVTHNSNGQSVEKFYNFGKDGFHFAASEKEALDTYL